MNDTLGFDRSGRPTAVYFKSVDRDLEIEIRPNFTWIVYRLSDPTRTPLDKSVVPPDVRQLVDNTLAVGRRIVN